VSGVRGTVVVTGAAGFVGSHTCRALAARGWTVRAMVRDEGKARERLDGVAVEFLAGDLRDSSFTVSALRGANAVVHCAAIAIERAGQTYQSVNTDATAALIAAARAASASRFIHLSQNGASSASPHRFLRSKGFAEDAVRASGLAFTALRPSVIFGPEDEFVNVLARLVKLSPVVYPLPGGGTARFQPVAVDDVAQCIAISLERESTIGKSYSLGGPEPLSLREIAERVLEAMGAHRTLVSAPVGALKPVVAIAQRVLPNPPVTTGLLALLDSDNITPDNALQSEFGIAPTPLDTTSLSYLRALTAGDALRSLFR
jgi:NADH dehydrogenase